MKDTPLTFIFLMFALLFLALSNLLLTHQGPEGFQNMINAFHLNKNKLKRNARTQLQDTRDYVNANVRSKMKLLGF